MRTRGITTFYVLLGYTAVSFAYFGIRLLPHPGRMLVGESGDSDPQIFIWSFAWWPHAILDWANPFVSRVAYAPTGVNLAWVTSVPGLAIPFAPLTLLFGPAVSYNVASIVLPGLSAWTAYLLFRNLTRSSWASIVAGYLYGFSSYALGHVLGGQLQLSPVLIPLIALVMLRYVRGELGARALAGRLGALVALQVYVGTEVAFTSTLMLGLALVLAFALVPNLRRRILSALPPVLAGYALAGLLAAPLVYYGVLVSAAPVVGAPSFWSADLLNLVVPTTLNGWGGQTLAKFVSHFQASPIERDSYLGLPVLAMAALLVLRRYRSAGIHFLVGAFVVATLFSFGTAFWVDGHRIFGLPTSGLFNLPGMNDLVPSRFALYATLAADSLVAMWITSTKGRVFRRPYVLPVLAAAALAPPFWTPSFVQNPQRLAFFSDGLYKACIPRNETLLIFPFSAWGSSMLWQAESGFWFKMVDGNLGPTIVEQGSVADPTIDALLPGYDVPSRQPSMTELLALARRRHIDRIVTTVTASATYPTRAELRFFGPVQQAGDVLVAPACGSPSLLAGVRASP